MENTCYKNSEFFSFMSNCTAFRSTTLEKVTCGGPGTVDNIVLHKKNTRQELVTRVLKLLNYLKDAQKWLENIHVAHFRRLEEAISLQDEKQLKVMDEITTVKSAVEEQSHVISDLRTYTEVVQQRKDSDFANVVASTVQNKLEKRDRKSNVVIYGAPGLMDHKSRASWCTNLLENIGCIHVDILSTDYVGNDRHGSNRPLKVRLKNSFDASKILQKAPLLREFNTYNGIYFSADLTADERRKKKELVIVLKEQIRTHPETRWKIRGNAIVDGGPFARTKIECRAESLTIQNSITSHAKINDQGQEPTVVSKKGIEKDSGTESEQDSDSDDSLAGYNFEDEPEHIKEAVNRIRKAISEELRNAPAPSTSDEDDSDED